MQETIELPVISKDSLILATKERRLHLVRGFDKNFPSWSDVNRLYEISKVLAHVDYNSFGQMIISNPHQKIKQYNHVIDYFKKIHNGELKFSMIIIGFLNKTNNIINKDALEISKKFFLENNKEIPEIVTIEDYAAYPSRYFEPVIHSDPEDRFFIQGSGSTMWKIFDDEKNIKDVLTLEPGDLVYIPKNLIHSVDPLSVRHCISIAFSDDPEIDYS